MSRKSNLFNQGYSQDVRVRMMLNSGTKTPYGFEINYHQWRHVPAQRWQWAEKGLNWKVIWYNKFGRMKWLRY